MPFYNQLTDFTGPDEVEVHISGDGRTLWVNVEGECVLRACRIKRLVIRNDAGGVVIEDTR